MLISYIKKLEANDGNMTKGFSGSIIIYITIGCLLIIYTIQDIRYKKIKIIYAIVAIPFLLLGIMLSEQRDFILRIMGVATGGMLYIFSILSREQLGKGDAIVLGITGFGLGFWNNLGFMLLGLLSAAVYSIVRMIIKGFRRKERIPLMPFLLMGYGFMMFLTLSYAWGLI